MVKKAETRRRKFDAKVDAETVKRQIEALKPLMLEGETAYFSMIEPLENYVKNIVEEAGVKALVVKDYLNFAREIFKLKSTYSLLTLNHEAQLKVNKWADRGLNGSLLVRIANLMGVDPSPPPVGEAVDVTDRAERLLGIVYGNLTQLQQHAGDKELLVWVNNFPLTFPLPSSQVTDLKNIRVLTASDIVSVNNLLNPHPTVVQYPSGVTIDPRAIRTLTPLDILTVTNLLNPHPVSGDLGRTWTLGAGDVPDLSDRAGRQVGKVYGSQSVVLKQRATSQDLLVQLQSGGSEIDPRSIRALTSSDVVTAVQGTRTNLKVQPEREDLISVGGVASPNNAGVQVVAGTGGQKIKVFDAGFHGAVDGLHYFYFGTTTTSTTKRFCTINLKGVIHKSFVQPRLSDVGDNLYLFSSVAETNMPYDLGYVKEA